MPPELRVEIAAAVDIRWDTQKFGARCRRRLPRDSIRRSLTEICDGGLPAPDRRCQQQIAAFAS
jgi:hypothetical protein